MYQLSQAFLRWWRRHISSKVYPLLTTLPILGFLLASASLWLFYKIAEEVLEKETQAIDTQILLSLHAIHSPWLDQVMLAITDLGQPTFLLIATLMLTAAMLWRKRRAETVTLAIAVIGAVGLNAILKHLFARKRPELWQRTVDVHFYSFPSGHAMVSMVVYGMLGYLLAAYYPRYRVGIAAGTIGLVAAIGLSRLYLGVHWPTDVVAGYAAGMVWLITCLFSLEIWKHRRREKQAKLH